MLEIDAEQFDDYLKIAAFDTAPWWSGNVRRRMAPARKRGQVRRQRAVLASRLEPDARTAGLFFAEKVAIRN